MNSTLDCIPCFIQHSVHVAKMVTDNPEEQADIVKQTLALVARAEIESTPPEMARSIHKIIRDITGVADPYKDVKDLSTDFALKLLPVLREEIAVADDPFETTVKLVIAGNIIDFGADRHFSLDTAHDKIVECLHKPIEHESVILLKKAMDNAGSILYMLDNCGEAVFDRLLIEPYCEKITIGVRGFPALNDITPYEVEHSNLTELCEIIDTGDSTPGVSMKYSKPEFLEVFNKVDLIISKGQGNFETMNESERPVFFLFRSKCKVIQDMVGDEELGHLHAVARNITI